MSEHKTDDRGPLVAAPRVTLQRHTSSLPTFLYLLSFCPPLPPLFSSPKAFFAHPGVIYAVGLVTASLSGVSISTLDLLYGRVWTKGITGVDATPELIRSTSSRVAWIMAIITVVYLVLSWIFLVCFSKAAQKLTVRLRHAYVSSALCQDSAWHDEHGAGEIAARAGKDINVIRVAFGEKLAFIVWSASTLITCLVTGFTQGARIAAVLWTLLPFTLLIFAILAIATDKVVAPMLKLEGKANSFIEEAFGGVRVTQAFSMRDRIVSKFEHKLIAPVLKLAFRRSALRSAETGLFYFSLTASYSFAFFIIARFRGETGTSLTVFFGCLNGLFALLNVVPMITNIQDAMSALSHMRQVIERVPLIDIRNEGGFVPDADTPGFESPAIEFRDVTMAYPSRPNVASLDNVSLTIPAGKVTALVGPSGSGKSTITELILRAYDPLTANVPHPFDAEEAREEKEQEDKKSKKKKTKSKDVEDGSSEKQLGAAEDSGLEKNDKLAADVPAVQGNGAVLYAEHDIRELNLVWLRSQIAVVRQAPQIFSGSIFENTAAGLIGTSLEYRPNTDGSAPTDEKELQRVALIRERVEVALRKAQAWTFVSRLPEGMDTMVSGGKTGLLSGGQRQRIAIARALVSEPRLLIIDEGTSALDSSTEAAIREMLEEEQRQRQITIILVAHRLSTIQHADQIVVMRAGCVVDRAFTTSDSSANTALMQTGRSDSTFRDMVTTQRALVEMPEPEPEKAEEQEQEELESVDYKLQRVFSEDAATTTVASANPSSPKLRSHNSKAQFSDLRRQLSSRQGHSYGVSARGGGGASQIPDYHDVERGDDKDEPGVDRGYAKKFLKTISDYKWLFITGIVGALAVGASFPVSGYLVGEVVESLSEPDNAERVRQTNKWSLIFLILAIADLILILTTSTALEVASEKLVARLKISGLRSLLHQEIGFFDSPDSQPGTIAANLASFPQNVGSATGLITSQILVSFSNLVGSVILAFVFSPKAAAVVLSPVVLLFFAGWLNVVMLERYETQVSGPAGEAAGKLAEAMDAYHEVITLGREQEIMRQMDERSRAQPKRQQYLYLGAAGFAISQAMILGVAAICFAWGGELFAREELDTKQLYAIFEAAIIGCFSGGRLLTYVPDLGRASSGFKSITRWMERKPIIATLIPENGQVPLEGQGFTGEGDIVFSNVEMRYPQRREHPALKALDLVIRNGQTHAFCGVSGGGKSSILQLCARFYDPCQGTIHVGGADVRSIPLEEFRASMSIVSQDPVLLSGTIKENIELGSLTALTQQEIEEACDQACILDFIRGLPDGFDTEIGSKGAQLSGGQKQRICIARAIVRRPRILLLDEATSALDAQSEHSVQRALDRAAKGRTTITIAHRLSTIRGADCIHVVEDGKIIESGTHAQLLAAGGRYLELIQAQL